MCVRVCASVHLFVCVHMDEYFSCIRNMTQSSSHAGFFVFNLILFVYNLILRSSEGMDTPSTHFHMLQHRHGKATVHRMKERASSIEVADPIVLGM